LAATDANWNWECRGTGSGTGWDVSCSSARAQCSGPISPNWGASSCFSNTLPLLANSGATYNRSSAQFGTCGSADIKCVNGNWQVQGGATCSACSWCSSQGVNWTGGCVSTVPGAPSGSAHRAEDNVGDPQGFKWYDCIGTTWTPRAGGLCECPTC
jgi:hypothetical protein